MKSAWLIPLLAAACVSGCATVPYPHGRNIETANTLQLRPGEAQHEVAHDEGLGHASAPSIALTTSAHGKSEVRGSFPRWLCKQQS